MSEIAPTQTKASSTPVPTSTSAQPEFLRSRPFADNSAAAPSNATAAQATSEPPPDWQTQLERASRYGFDFNQVKISGAPPPFVQRKLVIGTPSNEYEQEANPMAEQVMAMPETANPQLQRKLFGNAITQSIQRQPLIQPAETGNIVVQRYVDTTHKKTGDIYRVSDDRSLVVKQDSIYGSQALWAASGKAKAASDLFKNAKSVIRLREVGGSTLKIGGKHLIRVAPTNESNSTSGTGKSGMVLWADCGKSARDVIGAGQGTGGGAPKAVYTDPSGKQAETSGSSDPSVLKREMMMTYLISQEQKTGKTLIDKSKLTQFRQKRDKAYANYDAAEKAGKPKKTIDDLLAKYYYWDGAITDLIFEYYNNKLTNKQREEFDKQAGINRWADPGVGEGYTISTGGDPKAGKEDSTWNFHWAGVALKSSNGNDNVTLENYAVGDANFQNKEWVYQMYGSAKAAQTDPSKKGQTFHEQHRDVHGQHGETPTTMTVKPR